MTRTDLENRADWLDRVPLFAGLSPPQLRELADIARVKRCKRKQELFHKGDEGGFVYVVLSGRLKAMTTSADGDDVVFSIVGPGEVVGEIAMLAELPRTATVVALEPCELLALSRSDLLDFLQRNPSAALEMLRIVSLRLARVSEFVEDALFLNLSTHLAKKLVDLTEIYGEPTDAGLRLNLKLSQTELGDLVGVTRESINKQVQTWRREGLLSLQEGHVVIHRLDALKALANAKSR